MRVKYIAGVWPSQSTSGAGATQDTTGAGASYRRQALVQHKTPLVLARRTQLWALLQHNTQGILERAGAANVTVATVNCRMEQPFQSEWQTCLITVQTSTQRQYGLDRHVNGGNIERLEQDQRHALSRYLPCVAGTMNVSSRHRVILTNSAVDA